LKKAKSEVVSEKVERRTEVMRCKDEERARKGGIPHQISEYPAVKYLQSDDAEAKEWATCHSDELEALDKEHESIRRRIKKNEDGREFEIAELDQFRSGSGRNKGIPSKPDNEWLEEIYSQRPEDLYQLVSSEKLAKAIQGLTDHQRNVLFMNAIQEKKTKEITEILGTSCRNVLDVLERTYKRIKVLMNSRRGEGYIETCRIILGWITIPTFMFG